jgi:hypothetical protein
MTPTTTTEPTGWRLSIGCHRGTMMSRDTHSVTTKFQGDAPLESLEDCRECAIKWEANYRSMGLFLWYAKAIAPDGVQIQVRRGITYS